MGRDTWAPAVGCVPAPLRRPHPGAPGKPACPSRPHVHPSCFRPLPFTFPPADGAELAAEGPLVRTRVLQRQQQMVREIPALLANMARLSAQHQAAILDALAGEWGPKEEGRGQAAAHPSCRCSTTKPTKSCAPALSSPPPCPRPARPPPRSREPSGPHLLPDGAAPGRRQGAHRRHVLHPGLPAAARHPGELRQAPQRAQGPG